MSLCVCLKPQIIRFLIVRRWVWLPLRPHWNPQILMEMPSSFSLRKLQQMDAILKGLSVKIKYATWRLSREAFSENNPETWLSLLLLWAETQHNTTERFRLHAATVFNWLLFFPSVCARGNSCWERSKDLEVSAQGTVFCNPVSKTAHRHLAPCFPMKMWFEQTDQMKTGSFVDHFNWIIVYLSYYIVKILHT